MNIGSCTSRWACALHACALHARSFDDCGMHVRMIALLHVRAREHACMHAYTRWGARALCMRLRAFVIEQPYHAVHAHACVSVRISACA